MSLISFSCKKDDNDIIFGHEYFPDQEGKYVIYDVIDILHDDLSAIHDTSYYQIKEVVGEEDVDLEGESFKKLYRYIRSNDTLNWQLKDVWVLKKNARSVELVEENYRVIKMAFSISYDQYWDCNALNQNDPEQCYYADIYQPKTVGINSFDSTVVVEHSNFTSFIEYIRHYEIYAANVGKVQSYFKDLEIGNGDTTNALKGTELFYTAVSWGE